MNTATPLLGSCRAFKSMSTRRAIGTSDEEAVGEICPNSGVLLDATMMST
jgi:hypothetical protein